MPVSCEPSDLAKASACFDGIPHSMRNAVTIYLLATIAGGSMDPAVLTKEAACFACIPPNMVDAVEVMLLCTIVNK